MDTGGAQASKQEPVRHCAAAGAAQNKKTGIPFCRAAGLLIKLPNAVLEHDPQAELERTVLVHLNGLCTARRSHLAESGIAEIGVGTVKQRSVG